MLKNKFALCLAATAMVLTWSVGSTMADSFSGSKLEPGLVGTGPTFVGDDFPITQSNSLVPVAGSVSCNSAGVTAENSYYRTFNLASFGITQPYNITSLDLGIELAQAGSGGSQPIQIRYYSDTDADPATALVALGAPVALNLADTTLSVVNIPGGPSGVAPGGNLVVEVFVPDAITPATNHQFFIGSNAAGQTGPSYIRAPGCGLNAPAPLANIGFPNMHIVMRVNGVQVPEPSGLALGALSLLGLGFARRR